MDYDYLTDLWNDGETAGMDEPELLRYRSNLLGRDLRLTNFGGGNTSAKVEAEDPVTGDRVRAIWVKGSGGDLGTIRRDGFATLDLDRLIALQRRYRGPDHEDEMAPLYALCAVGGSSRAPSIDTPLHAFLPYRHVDHLHPDWAIAIAASANGPGHLEPLHKETGIRLIWLPWKRPGFELGLWLQKAAQETPDADGILLGSHGLFTWGDTSRHSYLNTLRVVDALGRYVLSRVERQGAALFGGEIVHARADRRSLAAEVLPDLRGMTHGGIGHFDDRPETLRFVGSARAEALARQGTSCPDHFLRTRVRPLFVAWDAGHGSSADLLSEARDGMERYRRDYAAYYEQNRAPDSPPMRSANPTVILAPGVGLFSFGKNKTEARIAAEFYVNAIHVMEGATSLTGPPVTSAPAGEVVDNYVALPLSEAFGIEYWSLEEAKLKRMPPEEELSRKVALVVGASPGIGQAIAERLAAEGAAVAVADRRPDLAEQSASQIRGRFGRESAVGVEMDSTDRESVRCGLEEVALAYGGLDILVYVSAVFFPPDSDGRIPDESFRKTLDVNLTGAMVCSGEAFRVFEAQQQGGSIVLVSSANAVVPKRGSVAYDVSKAALNHLARELAMEFAPAVRVNAVAPASVVEGSQQFPRERVVSSLTKYGVRFDDAAPTEELRALLSRYYAGRTLLKTPVTPAAVADAVFLLAGDRLGATTGHVLPVDSGLPEAFLR